MPKSWPHSKSNWPTDDLISFGRPWRSSKSKRLQSAIYLHCTNLSTPQTEECIRASSVTVQPKLMESKTMTRLKSLLRCKLNYRHLQNRLLRVPTKTTRYWAWLLWQLRVNRLFDGWWDRKRRRLPLRVLRFRSIFCVWRAIYFSLRNFTWSPLSF